ncbi:copper chaperone PCu(A)C [Actinoplanes regularis]|uniref:Copper(I)-binding protein n=2 Tax=Actinoplanes regularis TaxID=52697 RepID=A0A239HTD0_9ACTN|nr:copper chaperone PCu(A)C [Actinoplanes regularis]SNS84491.1 hypothetical protein SAMN06264365_12613 [Actinoplanes regularis]
MRFRTIVVVAAALVAGGLAACGDSATGTATAVPAAPPAAALTVKDPWVKAVDSGMTAAFGTLVNNTGGDVTVVGASSPVSPVELHEMAMQDGAMVMRPRAGGLVIKAGGTHVLAPGGDHLMLMKPSAAIRPGDELKFTLTLGDGGTVSFSAVAKPFAGAGESYAPSAMASMAP